MIKEKIYFALALWFIVGLTILAVFSTLEITRYFLCFGLVVIGCIVTFEIIKNYD